MTIFEFALLRAARQRMTPAELEVAQNAADRADRGEPGFHELLTKMIYGIIRDRSRAAVKPCCTADTADE